MRAAFVRFEVHHRSVVAHHHIVYHFVALSVCRNDKFHFVTTRRRKFDFSVFRVRPLRRAYKAITCRNFGCNPFRFGHFQRIFFISVVPGLHFEKSYGKIRYKQFSFLNLFESADFHAIS